MLRSSSQHVRLVRVRAEADCAAARAAGRISATRVRRRCHRELAQLPKRRSRSRSGSRRHRAQFRRRETCGLPHPSRSDNAHDRR